MNPEQQRIAIAEACGWRKGDLRLSWCHPDNWSMAKNGSCEVWVSQDKLPDFLHDLNAMHEAVSIFDYDQADQFEDHLCDICKRSNDEKENPAPWRFAVVNATASQRAEAFLRTIGKWEESK